MNKLVSRSLEILGKSVADVGKEYTSNVTSFINDAREVKNNIVKTTTDASDTFAKLKTTDITKKISDWFYGEENSYDASMGDDFDPGFKVDSSDEPKLDGEKSSRALDADSMGSITEKQTSMMLKIGRRQSEQSVANTAEIISVVNNRTSEMITSMNNINKTLIGISERIDKVIALQGVAATEDKAEDKNALFQDGKLSLARIFDVSKQSLSNNSLASTASIFLQSLTSGGGFGPDALASLGLSLLTGRKMDTLGGHSIDDIGKKFNEVVGAGIQTALNEAINSGPFQKINISGFNADQNYKDIVPNHYDTKRAMFDGMTRQSIVNVIPEMLAKINESISGNSYHLDNRGQWIKGPQKNEFAEVTQASFATANLSSRATAGAQRIFLSQQGRSVSDDDIKLATKALTMAIVMTKHYNGNEKGSFTISEFERDMGGYLDSAIKSLCTMRNDPAHWNAVCNAICAQLSSGLLDASAFVQNVNSSLDSMKKQAIAFAQSGKQNASQAGKLSLEMAAGQLFNEYRSGIKATQETDKPTDTPVVKKDDRSYELGRYGMGTYVKGIFGILNRGINVRVDKSGKKYEDYDINKIDPEKAVNTDDEFGKLFAQAMSGGGLFGSEKKGFQNMVKMGVSNKLNSLLGISDDTATGGVGGGGGFLSSLFGVGAGGLLSGAMRSVGESLFRGTFKEDTRKFFSDEGRGGQFINNTRDRVSTAFNNSEIGQSLAHDKRWIETKEYLTNDLLKSLSEKAKNAIGVAGDKIGQTGLYQKGYTLANNALYTKQSIQMNSAVRKLSNIDPSTIEDLDDRFNAEETLKYVNSGDLQAASESADKIKDEGLKNMISKHLGTISEIASSRNEAKTTIAEGGQASMGTVIQANKNVTDGDLNKSYQAGGVKGLIYTGFRFMGSVFRNTIGRALRQIRYGSKAIFEGLFGGKLYDKNGQVVYDEAGKAVKQKGLFQLLITDTFKDVKNVFGISGEGIKGTLGGILDKTGEAGKGVKKFINDISTGASSILNKAADGLDKIGLGGLKRAMDKDGGLLDKFRETSFGRGFMSSFDRVNAKKEAAERAERPFTTKKLKEIADAVTGKANGENAIAEQITSRFTTLINPISETLTEQAERSQENDEKILEQGEEGNSLIEDVIGESTDVLKEPAEKTIEFLTGEGSGPSLESTLKDVFEPLFDVWGIKVNDAAKDVTAEIENNTDAIQEGIDNVKDKVDENTEKREEEAEESEEKADERQENNPINDVAGEIKNSGGLKGLFKNLLGGIGGFFKNIFGKGGGTTDGGADVAGGTIGGIFDIAKSWVSAGLEGAVMGGGDTLNGLSIPGMSGGTTGSTATPPATGTNPAAAQAATQATTQATTQAVTQGATGSATKALGGLSGGDPISAIIGLIIKRIGGMLEAIGKIVGGILNLVKGIVGAVISTALAMESFKAIKKAVNDILVDGVKPLNEAFDDILDAIEPVTDVLTEFMEEIMVAVNDMLEVSLEIIKPILLELEPLLQSMISEFLKPLLKDIMVPLFVSLKAILPYVEMMAYSLEMVIGNTEIVIGSMLNSIGRTIAILGAIASGVGKIINLLKPGFQSGGLEATGKKWVEAGQKMASDGANMVAAGQMHASTGLKGIGNVLGQLFTGNYDYDKYRTEEKKSDVADTNEVNMDHELGAGDVNTTTYNYSYMYGSGNTMNQHTYGSYMNMSERGCGPVVLADAYNRRSGGMMNPATLASAMLGAGTYDPARGTQTGDLMRTSNMLGMPLKMGGVTQNSLKKASPDNPITILGSGTGFGTKTGNNHYVNVIGTDSNGGAYVSNPMTGRVERQSLSNLTLNSKLGLYGSGDDDDNDYGFDSKTRRAFEKLRDLTDNLTGMFVGNTSSYIKKAEDEASNKSKATRIEASLEEEEYAKLKARVIEELSRQNPKRDGETEEDYSKRIEDLFNYSPEAKELLVKYDSESGSTLNRIKKGASSVSQNVSDLYNTLSKDIDIDSSDGFFSGALSFLDNLKSSIFGSSGSSRGRNAKGYTKNKYMEGSFWGPVYEQKFSNSNYHEQAQKAGLTGAQEAMIAAIGIHEDSAQKLVGEKSITKVTQDVNGQKAFGIMNWIPDEKNSYVGADETKYGTTLAEQLPYMRKMYFDESPTHDRARIIQSNFNQYESGLSTVLEHDPKLRPGDPWGPIAETDLPESMGHYVANALVPGNEWYTTEGLGKRIGTAVDAYNWMVSKGWINTSSDTFESAGGAKLYTPYTPTITETNIQGYNDYHSPLFEFFAETMGLPVGSIYGSGWFGQYNNPDSKGEGSSGDLHSGVDFTGGSINGKPLYATTGGTVISNNFQSNGAGNYVIWQDDAGKYHWYMHMNKPSTLTVGQQIEGGDLIGYAGSTGYSTGPHLHYTINDSLTSSGSGHIENPLTYFTGGGDSDDIPPVDQSLFDDLYNNLNNNGMSTIINKYDIKSDTKKLDDILDKMGKMTFNVRAQRVEELLEELIEKVSDEKPDKPSPSNDTTDTNLFQNKPIPEQIQRLAKG